MKKIAGGVVVVAGLVFSVQGFAGWSDTLKGYSCIEIEKFAVDREDYSSKEKERAATISEEKLANLQHKIVGEATRKNIAPKVTKSNDKPCTGKALVFGGKVTDYKEGSRAARILIGMGAGKQKFEVESYLKDKQTGEVLKTKTIVDRKVGGLAGGDEAKGEHDFAEKIVSFMEEGK